MQEFRQDDRNICIMAREIEIHPTARIGNNVQATLHGRFQMDANSYLGSGGILKGHDFIMGEQAYQSRRLIMGGGGWQSPSANLIIGKRCVIQDVFANVGAAITFEDDSATSQKVDLITHGFWENVLDGYPNQLAPITIKSKALLGHRVTVLPGVTVGEFCFVAAGAVVAKDTPDCCVVGGVPARKLRDIEAPPLAWRVSKLQNLVLAWSEWIKYAISLMPDHPPEPHTMVEYPLVHIDDCVFDVGTLSYSGAETPITDDFRHWIRRYGIKFYSDLRPFRSLAWHWPGFGSDSMRAAT